MADEQELMRQIARAGARIAVPLSDRDVERLVAGGLRRRQQRTARRLVAAGAASLCLATVAAVVLVERPSSSPTMQVAAPAPSRPAAQSRGILRLVDGSTATALEPNTQLAVAEDARDRTTVVLARGRGRFDVKPRAERRFVVEAGAVTITVLGTVFTVERVADRIGLTVEAGTVRVAWGVGTAILSEGESGWYPPLVASAEGRVPVVPAAKEKKSLRAVAAQGARRASRQASMAATQGLARVSSGPRPEAANLSLAPGAEPPPSPSSPSSSSSPSPSVRGAETAEALLSAADSARVAGQPATGAELLRRLVREHAHDPRAPFAAFTLGRILLIEMHDAAAAADAFAQARSLAPQGPLAEDALAREVEALSQSGKRALAKLRAEDYLRFYPSGRRAKAVRVAGGLE
jgi:transmembrane sensor